MEMSAGYAGPACLGPDVLGAAVTYKPQRSQDRDTDEDSERLSEDHDGTGPFQEGMTEEELSLAKFLIGLAGFDVLISGSVLCIAFAHAYVDNGVSLYCLGIQALSHCISSFLLGLRFLGECRLPADTPAGPREGLLRQRRRVSLLREQRVAAVTSIVMYMSSFALLVKACRKFMYWDTWYLDHLEMDHDAVFATVFLSWYGFCVYSGQAIVRGYLGRKLKRRVLWDAFMVSLVSLLFLLLIAIAATLEKEWSWKAEPLAAIVLSFVTVGEGTRALYRHSGDVDKRLQCDSRA